MSTSWIKPAPETPGLSRYLKLVRTRLWLIVATVAVALGGAAGYLARAEKVYEASVDLLVSPVAQDSPLIDLGLPRESSDPTRDVSTVARLVGIVSVADRVKQELKLPQTSKQLLSDIKAEPVALSSIVNVSVKSDTAVGAQQLANAVGDAFIAERTERMQKKIEELLPGLRSQVKGLPRADRGSAPVAAKLRQYAELRTQQDPTLRVEVPASLPSAPTSPKPVLSVAVALIGGLVLGLGGVFALQLLDPRLRREDQLSERFSVPVLAAIPTERGPRRGPPLRRSQLSAGAQEGYNQLRAALTVARRISTPGGRTVMITGPSRGDGKTTSAINLAAALANGRQDVILLDADWRRPAVGRALDLNSGLDLHADMQHELSLEQALVTIGEAGAALRVLPTVPGSVAAEVALSSPDAESLLLRATALADWVVVDAPPLNHVPDLLALARQVDDVVLVVHLGRTDLSELTQLTEMLTQHNITPAGFVVIGASRGYY